MEEFSENKELGLSVSKFNKKKKIIFYAVGAVVFLFFFYFFFLSAPGDFPTGAVVEIDSGMSLRSISALLKKEHLIRSRVVFEYSIIFLGGEKHIVSADYLFEKKLPVWQVVWRIARGEHHLAPISVTIPEGFDVNQMTNVFVLALPNFDKIQFLAKAQSLEGFLFPDTYFFLRNANETVVLKSMNDNFEKKITPLLPAITSSGKREKDIIELASVLEREAKGDADRGIIAGILWKRIKIGMPLQVDSAPETYKTKGLPQSPIGNPGLKAIESAINPETSPYLYYLHDKNGNIHYAVTFAEHQANIRKYLK